ncbi:aspartate/glutamate racemase family protein [Campylobacter sp. 19-13652]|uniref:aspartate/glutamate racemase family protein n=1 Tax=Campylobacter sp. 19-13652 TaxID=2840180 RepID=UPI001C75C801|nr:aspartate/glutamate racemase family protein [Campylobacter sp. 19-13652]BCX80174.1 racemase [Campylobacter sp. 19-13652]
MKIIGLIGGMSYQSTITYYQAINEGVAARLGGLSSAKCVIYSVDFASIESFQRAGKWDEAGAVLLDAARQVTAAGADFVLLCTNTMHKIASILSANGINLLHIATATAERIKRDGVRRVGLLGTKYTMTQDFYKGELERAGLDVIVPEGADVDLINDIIFNELCKGEIKESSRREFVRIIGQLDVAGADGVILGCTEIGLLVSAPDTPLRLYDTTLIHAEAAVRLALG